MPDGSIKLEILGAEFFKDPRDASRFLTKASAFRAFTNAIKDAGLLPRVMEHCPQAARELIDDPPLPISWMPAVIFQYLFRALERETDGAQLRALAKQSVMTGPMKMMRPIIEGTLRLFGASPVAFFRRMPGLMENQVKGIEFEFEEIDDTSATLLVSYPYLRDVPEAAFVYWEAVVANTFDICGRKGTAKTIPLPGDPDLASANIVLEWDA